MSYPSQSRAQALRNISVILVKTASPAFQLELPNVPIPAPLPSV